MKVFEVTNRVKSHSQSKLIMPHHWTGLCVHNLGNDIELALYGALSMDK